jgi:hypothetical protein
MITPEAVHLFRRAVEIERDGLTNFGSMDANAAIASDCATASS